MREPALKASPASSAASLLTVRGLQGWYGESHVLHGIDIDVKTGEVVTLLGRNGAGKTTTLRAIIGILGRRSGSIVYDGVETIGMASRKIAKLGLGYVPEERGIFSSLNVEENLMLPPLIKQGGMTVDADADSSYKIPLLGDIPLLGNLFKVQQRNRSRTERLFLITPRLVTLGAGRTTTTTSVTRVQPLPTAQVATTRRP